MAETAPLHVQLIAKTEFVAPSDVPWSTDADGGQALLEFAGRACYQSWSKPNPKTATNAGYLQHIIDVGVLAGPHRDEMPPGPVVPGDDDAGLGGVG